MAVDFPEHELEERVRKEFRAAIDEMERASGKEKAEATARLNRATRRLYDLVAHGKVQKVQMDLRSRTSGAPAT